MDGLPLELLLGEDILKYDDREDFITFSLQMNNIFVD